jgi:hypothetical protein
MFAHSPGTVPARADSPVAPAAPVIVEPKAGKHRAPEGHVRIRWRYPGSAAVVKTLRFELQQATTPSFANARIRYVGPDRACFLSGLPEGTFHYRVRALAHNGPKGPWSKPRTVQVRYASMGLVAALMVLGLLLLVATVLLILHGHRKTRQRAAPRDEEQGAPA